MNLGKISNIYNEFPLMFSVLAAFIASIGSIPFFPFTVFYPTSKFGAGTTSFNPAASSLHFSWPEFGSVGSLSTLAFLGFVCSYGCAAAAGYAANMLPERL